MRFKKIGMLLLTYSLSFQSFAASTYYMKADANGVKESKVYVNAFVDMIPLYKNFYTSASLQYDENFQYDKNHKALNFFGPYFSQVASQVNIITISFDLKRPVALSGIKTNWTINSGSAENKWARLIKLYTKNDAGTYVLAKTLDRTQKIQDFIFDKPLASTSGMKLELSGSKDINNYQGVQQILFYEKTLGDGK